MRNTQSVHGTTIESTVLQLQGLVDLAALAHGGDVEDIDLCCCSRTGGEWNWSWRDG